MEDLIKKAKSGDKLAFTELMLQMQDELYKIAKIRLKNDDDVFDAAAAALLDQVGDCSRAGGNDCQIDAGANVFNRLIGFDVEDGFVFGIDRVKSAFIARGGNVFEQDVADRVVPIRCADDGDRFGLK